MFRLFSTTKPRTLAIVSIPTAGHIKILIRLANEAKKTDFNLKIKFILTSWSGYEIRESDKEALLYASDNNLVILESETTAHNKEDTFGRAVELMDGVIKACIHCDSIFYDFMTPEGYVAGEFLSIPTVCVEPSYIGVFDTSSEEYHKQLKQCKSNLNIIKRNYSVDLNDKLKLISGALSVLSSKNILFSWKSFIYAGNFDKNTQEEKEKYLFMRPSITENVQLDKKFSYIQESGKKVVYFSLGTIASSLMWDVAGKIEEDTFREFVRLLYNSLINIFSIRQDLILIISSGRNIKDIIGERTLPENIYSYEALPQAELLHFVDLFITHCGANSVNEAIDAETPMIGIPLMFDQHECAAPIDQLGIGKTFLHPSEKRDAAVYFNSNLFFRDPLVEPGKAEQALEEVINEILSKDFSHAFTQIKSNSTLSFASIPKILDSSRTDLLQEEKLTL